MTNTAQPSTNAETQSGHAEFLRQLRTEFEGMELGPPLHARFPVNETMIAHWCDAMEDWNPVYLDPEIARVSVHGGIVAPPAMLQAWIMPGLAPRPQDKIAAVKRAFAEAGFTSVVATNCEQEYLRYLRPGDALTATGVLESISEQKQTGLGDGYFVTTRTMLRDAAGELVGTHMFRIICFKPRQQGAAQKNPADNSFPFQRPAVNEDTEFFWDGCRRDELLIQRCTNCGQLRHPPMPMCPHCQSTVWDTVTASGHGTLYSYVVVHHPLPSGVGQPYVVGLVELDEGVRFVANVKDVRPDEAEIGMPLELRFNVVDEDLTVPSFRPLR